MDRERTEDLLPGSDAYDPHWSASIFAIWNLIIRPPRHRYSRVELLQGFPSERFKVGEQIGSRRHFHIMNERGLPLACTVFEPIIPSTACASLAQEKACVVHCHGNGASRLSGFQLAHVLLPLGISVCCFDFSGSGMSGGDYVSLGFFERDDLHRVIEHLRIELSFSRIALWGYSMGAATALMHASRDPSIAGVVADSPFCDLWQLIQEVLLHFLRMPPLLSYPVLQLVRLVIQQKANFDICDVSPQAHVCDCFVPALFLHGELDDFVEPSHSETLRRVHRGEAQRLTMPARAHASHRADAFTAKAAVFLVRALRWEQFLPSGHGDRAFSELLAGRLSFNRLGGFLARDEALPLRPESMAQVGRLLVSSQDKDVCSGLLQAALGLCGPYRGAEFLPCSWGGVAACATPCGSRVNSTYRSAPTPAHFFGKVTFFDSQAEVALCWLRAGSANLGGGRVEFAVISPTVASLSSVFLEPRLKCRSTAGTGPSSGVSSSSTPGDLQCTCIEPKDLGTLSLEVNQPHDISLRISPSGRTTLLINGQPIVHGAASAGVGDMADVQKESKDAVHLWCVQWRLSIEGGGAQLELNCGAEPFQDDSPTSSIAAAGPLEDRLAETLATLCLGAPGFSSAARAKLRSGIYLPSEASAACEDTIKTEYSL